MKLPDTYVAHYLTIGEHHQLADLRPMLVCPDYVQMTTDGCLQFVDGQAHDVDGYDHVVGGLHMPFVAECHERLHAMHFADGEVLHQMWCMHTSAPTCNTIVTAKTCETCPHRRGRV
jgi:hypothetical protein